MNSPTPAVFWIDTNIIIRFITNDHPIMTPEVALLMEQAENGQIILRVAPLVIAECCWVLQSPHYHFAPSDIADVLTSFIIAKGIDIDEKDIILNALDRYATTYVDYIDAYLAALANAAGSQPVITYNTKDFERLSVLHYRPSQITSS